MKIAHILKQLENKSGFISVLALGIVINAALLAVGIFSGSQELDARHNQKAPKHQMYETRLDIEQSRLFTQSTLRYLDESSVKFTSNDNFVRFPKRDRHGNIIEEENNPFFLQANSK